MFIGPEYTPRYFVTTDAYSSLVPPKTPKFARFAAKLNQLPQPAPGAERRDVSGVALGGGTARFRHCLNRSEYIETLMSNHKIDIGG